MPRPNFSSYRDLDALGDNKYEAIITDIPGALPGADKELILKCQGFVLPGAQQGRLTIPVQGFQFYNSSGSTIFTGTFSITYYEDSNFSVSKTMRAWKEVTAGTESGAAGGNKSAYARTIILRMYNPQDQPVGELSVFGCFPETIPEITAQASQTPGVVSLQIGFSFDYHSLAGVDLR